MAKSVMRPEGEEIAFFHANYIYMWKKLNTAPYYVSSFGECPAWIRAQQLLPSYVNLSRCMNPDFVPSLNIINKIVAFYNANITPSVDTFTFLHEHLEDSDRGRTALVCSSPEPFCGLYYCYYYGEEGDAQPIRGALLSIHSGESGVRACMIKDITEEEALFGTELRELLCADAFTPERFKAYKAVKPLQKRLLTCFHGTVKVNPGVIMLRMQRADRDGEYLSLYLPIEASEAEQFIGSLGAAVLLTEDRSFRFFRMGAQRADHPELKPLSLKDSKLLELLALKKGANEQVSLSPGEKTAWINHLVFHA